MTRAALLREEQSALAALELHRARFGFGHASEQPILARIAAAGRALRDDEPPLVRAASVIFLMTADLRAETRPEHRAERQRHLDEVRARYSAGDLALIDAYLEAAFDYRAVSAQHDADKAAAKGAQTVSTVARTSFALERSQLALGTARLRVDEAKRALVNEGLSANPAPRRVPNPMPRAAALMRQAAE